MPLARLIFPNHEIGRASVSRAVHVAIGAEPELQIGHLDQSRRFGFASVARETVEVFVPWSACARANRRPAAGISVPCVSGFGDPTVGRRTRRGQHHVTRRATSVRATEQRITLRDTYTAARLLRGAATPVATISGIARVALGIRTVGDRGITRVGCAVPRVDGAIHGDIGSAVYGAVVLANAARPSPTCATGRTRITVASGTRGECPSSTGRPAISSGTIG